MRKADDDDEGSEEDEEEDDFLASFLQKCKNEVDDERDKSDRKRMLFSSLWPHLLWPGPENKGGLLKESELKEKKEDGTEGEERRGN